MTEKDKKRFLSKFKQGEKDKCWLWEGYKDKDGYGNFQFNGSPRQAHRVSYELFVRPIPEGLCVCHSCDVPSCVNFNHLWLGTCKENQADCARKGRRSGENNPMYGRTGENNPNLGKHHTKEAKDKMSESQQGEKGNNAILTEAQAFEIKHSSLKSIELAKIYGVHYGTIYAIKNGLTWKYLK
jgi:hypothetical protein